VTVKADPLQTRSPGAPQTREALTEAAFESLFLSHWPRVYGALVRLLGDPAEAEDLALEAFWRLYRHPPQHAGVMNSSPLLRGWLYRVAMNLGYNALRAAKRRLRYEEAAGREALERDVEPDPDDVAAQADERARVRAVLNQLAPREAQLLLLRHSGLAYKELAAALGVAPASIGTLLARAEREFERRWLIADG
jgi:RNA polymerase sigma-70 factor (ECF subfamily)